MNPLTTSKDKLAAVNATVERFEKAGAHLVFIKGEVVVHLKKGRVELALNDGNRCSVVNIDLSHPDNEKMLGELAKGLDGALTLKAIEVPLIRMGMMLNAVTKPLFEKMPQALGHETIQVVAARDGTDKLISLKAKVEGKSPEEVVDAEDVIKRVSDELDKLGMREGYKFEMIHHSSVGTKGMQPTSIPRFLEWLQAPIPKPSAKRPTAWAPGEPDGAYQRKLQLLLETPVENWKAKFWELFESLHPGRSYEIPTTLAPEKEAEIAQLQSLLDEYAMLGLEKI